jgi:hypothetical protein
MEDDTSSDESEDSYSGSYTELEPKKKKKRGSWEQYRKEDLWKSRESSKGKFKKKKRNA